MKKESAFPVHGGNGDDTRNHTLGGGLTKRELFAAMAIQGLCANPEYAKQQHEIASALEGDYVMDPLLAKRSVEIADELLKKLEL